MTQAYVTQVARTAATLPPLAGSGAPAQESDGLGDCDVPAAPPPRHKEAGARGKGVTKGAGAEADDETEEEEELAGEAGEKAAAVRARAGNVADSVCNVSCVCVCVCVCVCLCLSGGAYMSLIEGKEAEA